MEIYLNADDREFQLPVNPSVVSIGNDVILNTVEVFRVGEVDWAMGDDLRRVVLESFFPAQYVPAYCAYPDPPDPLEAAQLLDLWKDEREILRLLVTEMGINLKVRIASFNYESRGGEPGDIYYRLEVRQYRSLEILDEMGTGQAPGIEGPEQPEKPETYTVVGGDTLWEIARRIYGDGSRWPEIYAVNEDVVGPDPNLIVPGQVFRIP